VPTFEHKSVLIREVVKSLDPRPSGRYADGTVGGGGHAAAILAASSPTGWLFGCDRDGIAIEAARAKLAEFSGRFELRRGNYGELCRWVPAESCDGVLLDLGVSSPQLDVAERGFSFQLDGPLDMRMDRQQALTAAELVNREAEQELARMFWEYGGERDSRRLARAIARQRERSPFTTTRQLADLIEQVSPRRGQRAHPATKVFQALRIAVNDELRLLRVGLEGALQLLRHGGRLAVITFHSLEDRIVKEFGRELARDYAFPGSVDLPELRQPRVPQLRWLTRKAIHPGEKELAENPRSRSAQLRVMEKI
jgi:16S rRNA (cytosine1402-N4)-methyltransferase